MYKIENYTTELYRKYSMFNMTRFIEELYKNGLSLTQEQLDAIDFSEESEKLFYLYHPGEIGQQTYHSKESLALNLVEYLPFEAYKKYMTWEWLSFGKNNSSDSDSFVRSCLFAKKFDVLSYCIQLGKEELNKMPSKNIDFGMNVKSKCLNFLVNINFIESLNFIEWSEKDIISYFSVFQEALEEFSFIKNQISKRNKLSEKDYLNPKLWLKNLPALVNSYNGNTKADKLLEHIFKKTSYFPIFLDIIEQANLDSETYNLVFTKNNLNNALIAGNNNAFTILKEKLFNNNLSFQTYFEPLFVKTIQDLNHLFRDNYKKEKINSAYIQHVNHLLDILEIHSNHVNFISTKDLFQLMNGADQQLGQRLFKIFPHLYDSKTSDDYSILQVLHHSYHLTHFMKEYQLEFQRDKFYPTVELGIHNAIYEALSPIFTQNFLPVQDSTDDYIKKIMPSIKEISNEKIALNSDLSSMYAKYKISHNVPENEINKIKAPKGKI